MTLDINPNKIQNGYTWEAMMQTLLMFIDSRIRVYSREGRDFAIDAFSGDGTTVYQAKHHKTPTISQTITDAKNELTKIIEYRKNKSYWKPVNNWILFTNLQIHVEDENRWNDEIIPLFSEIGIKAVLWHWGIIHTLLCDHQVVIGPFFKDEPRIFHTISDEIAWQKQVNWFPPSLEASYVGREEASNELEKFLKSDKKIWAISGAGGMGKTRFLLECAKKAEKDWIAYWCSPDGLCHPSLYEGIVPERPILLLIDELGSDILLPSLLTELTIGRMKSWKIIFTERTSDSKPIETLKEAKYAGISQPAYTLLRLNNPQSEDLLKQLLLILQQKFHLNYADTVDNVASRLERICDGIPLWIGLSVKLLLEDNDLSRLPKQAQGLLKKYLDTFFDSLTQTDIPKDNVRTLLNWIALAGKLEADTQDTLTFFSTECSISKKQVCDVYRILVDKGIAFRYGANGRFLKIAPDSIRDEILKEALIDISEPTAFAKYVVTKILQDEIPNKKEIIQNLAAIEFIQDPTDTAPPLDLLSPVINTIAQMAKTESTLAQLSAIELVHNFSFSRPTDAIQVLRNCWDFDLGEPPESKLGGGRYVFNHTSVRKEISWALFQVAHYAVTKNEKKEVYSFYNHIMEDEQKLGVTFSCNSETAQSLLGRLLFSEYWSNNYEDLVTEKAEELIHKIENNIPLTQVETNVFIILFSGLTCAERMVFGPSFGNRFSIGQKHVVPGESKEWARIEHYLNKIKDLLLNPVLPEALRQDIAKIYAAVLPAVNRYVLPEGEEHDSPQIKAINKFITEEFCWLKRLFRDKKYNLSFTMRNILRETWSWHYKYSKNVELRNAANLCEEAYYINENHSALDKFLNYNLLSVEALEKQYLDAYMRWIKDKPTQTILDFLQEASLYDPTCVHAYNVSFLGTQLGKELNDEKQFNELCKTLLPFSNPSYQWYFVTSLLKSYLMQIRTNNPENAVEILRQYITDVSDISVLIINYYSQPWRDVGQLVPEDLKFVVQYIQSYNDSFKKYHLLAELTFCFWTELTKLIDETWEQMSNDDKTNYCYGLINNAPYLKSIKKYNKFEWKPEYSQWLIDKLCLIENVDWLDNQRYHLDNFLPLKGCKSVSWLLEIIQKRNKQFGDSTVFSHRFYLTYFVKPDFDNDADIAALDTLIEMSTENTMVGYDLPSYLRRLDTESIKLGAIVAQKIADTKDIERILQLAEIGGAFHRNTKAWNEISAAVCAASQELPEKERISLYVALDGHRIQDCSHSIGQVPVFYCKQLSDNKEGMEKEENPIRNEYWKKEVEWAERQLLRAEEDAKEERGE